MRMHAHACVYVRLGGRGVGVVGRGGCFQTPVGSYWVLFTAFLKSGSEWMPDDAFDKRQETPIYHPASCSYQLICCFLFPLQEMKQSVLLLCMRNNRLKYSKDNLGIAEDNLTTKLVLILMTVRKGKTLEIVLYFIVHLFCQTLLPLSSTSANIGPTTPLESGTGMAAGDVNIHLPQGNLIFDLTITKPICKWKIDTNN